MLVLLHDTGSGVLLLPLPEVTEGWIKETCFETK